MIATGRFLATCRSAAMALSLSALATAGAGLAWPAAAQDYATVVAAPDRSDADRQTDKRRDPVKLLEFIGVRAGMKVLDVGAGGGYSTELLARAVGPGGTVYAQDSQDVAEGANVKARYGARAETPAMKSVVRTIRPYDDPAAPEAKDLDLVTFLFMYHDTTYMEVDRAAMNRKLFAALKPGGHLVIADHSAKEGAGTTVGKTLHRIEESALRREVEAAGFRLVAAGDFLRHAEDPRDGIIFRSPVPVDEFVLKFEKPR